VSPPTHPYRELRFPDDHAEPITVEPYVSAAGPLFCRIDGTPIHPVAPHARVTRVRSSVPRSRRRASHRGRPGHRRSGRTSTTSSNDPGDDGEPWPGVFTFRAFDELVSTALPGHVRLRLFHALPERWQREAWDALGRETDRKAAAR
jgi:hypothetical protein